MAFPLLALLGLVPSLFEAGADIVSAVTGKAPPAEARTSPEALAAHIESLPPDQKAEIQRRFYEHVEALDRNATERFKAMTAVEGTGEVEAIRATARPEIARQMADVITTFSFMMKVIFVAMVAEYLVRAGVFAFGCETVPGPEGAGPVKTCAELPDAFSVTAMLAKLGPVSEMIWGPLIASFWIAADVVKTYMGCRERDKARADEMAAGKPLTSAAATIEAAGGGIAGIIRAFKGAK